MKKQSSFLVALLVTLLGLNTSANGVTHVQEIENAKKFYKENIPVFVNNMDDTYVNGRTVEISVRNLNTTQIGYEGLPTSASNQFINFTCEGLLTEGSDASVVITITGGIGNTQLVFSTTLMTIINNTNNGQPTRLSTSDGYTTYFITVVGGASDMDIRIPGLSGTVIRTKTYQINTIENFSSHQNVYVD